MDFISGEIGIHASQLGEGEGGSLHEPSFLLLRIKAVNALVAQGVTQHDEGGDVCQWRSSGLRNKWHCTRRTWIYLNHVYVFLTIYDKLYVVKTFYADFLAETHRIVENCLLRFLADAESGVDTDGVAGVYSGMLHMLHYSGHEYVFTIADGIHLKLLTHDVFVDEHGMLHVDLDGCLEILAQLMLVAYYLHGASAKHVAGSHKHWIAYAFRCLHSILDIGYSHTFGLRYL